MADLNEVSDSEIVDATGKTLKNKPANSLNKSSRKVGIKNPKQKMAVAIKYKKFAGKL